MWLVWTVYVILVLVVFKAQLVVQFIELKRRMEFAWSFPGPPVLEILENKKRKSSNKSTTAPN